MYSVLGLGFMDIFVFRINMDLEFYIVLLLQSDRFISHRGSMDFDVARYLLTEKENDDNGVHTTPSKESYKRELAASLLQNGDIASKKYRILSFTSKAPAPPEDLQSLYSGNVAVDTVPKSKSRRYIPQVRAILEP
jgi:hypothetical protein